MLRLSREFENDTGEKVVLVGGAMHQRYELDRDRAGGGGGIDLKIVNWGK